MVNRRTSEYLWRHIGHAASYASVQPAFRVMNRYVEVGEVNVPVGVQDDIIRLNVTARRNQSLSVPITGNRSVRGSRSLPVNDLLAVEIVACRRQFSGPEADTPLVDLALAFHMDYMRVNGKDPVTLDQIRDEFSICYRNKGSRVLTPQVASEHEIQDEETVVVVLESVSHVHDEWMVNLVKFGVHKPGSNKSAMRNSEPTPLDTDLFEQPSFLDDVGNGSLFGTLRLVDILQREQFL